MWILNLRWPYRRYLLRCQIIDNIGCGIVLFSQWEQRCNSWKSDSYSKHVSHVIWSHSPMPESKSGTNAASVMMRSWISLRPLDQFWGSFSESVGWGHNTFVPSWVSFRRAATSSPSSAFACLCSIIGLKSILSQRTGIHTRDQRWDDRHSAHETRISRFVGNRYPCLALVSRWVCPLQTWMGDSWHERVNEVFIRYKIRYDWQENPMERSQTMIVHHLTTFHHMATLLLWQIVAT